MNNMLSRRWVSLIFTRDVVLPRVKEHPESLDLDIYASPCGTYACLGGWYCALRYGDPKDPQKFLRRLSRDIPFTLKHDFELNFDHSIATDRLFGMKPMGSLEERERYLHLCISSEAARLGLS